MTAGMNNDIGGLVLFALVIGLSVWFFGPVQPDLSAEALQHNTP